MQPITVFAPGRVELLGNHTDYNEGLVLAAALPQGVSATGFCRGDGLLRLTTQGTPALSLEKASSSNSVELSIEALQPHGDWSDYPAAVFSTLHKQGASLGGVEIAFKSSLPAGAGLSSSAALEVATILLLQRLFGFQATGLELARLCRRAENEFVGVNCGLLDQATSLFGKRQHAILLDARTETISSVAVSPEACLLIIHSGMPHALVGGAYNERREQCFAAAKALSVTALRDVSMQQLQSSRALLTEVQFHRALHIVGENERVARAVVLLSQGALEDVGRLMVASHESSRLSFENSTPELDLLVALAKKTRGVYGARLTGGGFGGSIVALVERSSAEAAGATIEGAYQQQTGHDASVLMGDLSDGALALDKYLGG